MQITPVAAVATASDFETFVAHELFHCYQGIWLGLDRYYDEQGGSWAIEGSATWAGYNIATEPPSKLANWYYQYVVSASTPLFAREHDAVGFFGQVAQRGVDLWPLMKQFIQTSGDVARYDVLADAAGDDFLDGWGPGYWLAPGRSAQWRIEGKAAPPPGAYYSPAGDISVGNGASVSLHASPYTVGLYTGSPTADVTEVKVTGHARLADTGSFDTNDLTDTFLCTKTDGACTCPSDNDDTNGSNGLPASIQKVSQPLIMGVTGATDGSKGAVVGMSLDTWCKSRNKKKATTVCQVLDVAELDAITGLHITKVKDDGNVCVYADPSAPPSNVLKSVAGAITKAFTGNTVDLASGAGVVVRLRTLDPGPDPRVSDFLDEIPAGLCDTPQLVPGLNAASAICLGVLNVVVVGNGKYAAIVDLAPGNSATHDQGAQLARAAARAAVTSASDGFPGDALAVLLAAVVAAGAWLTWALLVWFRRVPRLPRAGPETATLGPEPPAVANLLVNEWYVTSEAVPATLLDLAAWRVRARRGGRAGPVRRSHARCRPFGVGALRAAGPAAGGGEGHRRLGTGRRVATRPGRQRVVARPVLRCGRRRRRGAGARDEGFPASPTGRPGSRARGGARSRRARVRAGTRHREARAPRRAADHRRVVCGRVRRVDRVRDGHEPCPCPPGDTLRDAMRRAVARRACAPARRRALRRAAARRGGDLGPDARVRRRPRRQPRRGRCPSHRPRRPPTRLESYERDLAAGPRTGAQALRCRRSAPRVLVGGVVRLLAWCTIGVLVLRVAVNVLSALPDATGPGDLAVLALALVFITVPTIAMIYVGAHIVDGAVRTWRGAMDLHRMTTVEGSVAKTFDGRFVVDNGDDDDVIAFRVPASTHVVVGERVRVTYTPRLHHVDRVDVLEREEAHHGAVQATPPDVDIEH